jgi:hypothetical protein
MSRAACRKSLAARRSPTSVSDDTVEGFDAAAGDFRRSPEGRGAFGRLRSSPRHCRSARSAASRLLRLGQNRSRRGHDEFRNRLSDQEDRHQRQHGDTEGQAQRDELDEPRPAFGVRANVLRAQIHGDHTPFLMLGRSTIGLIAQMAAGSE